MGNTTLYLDENCPDHPDIRINGVRITEGPLFVATLEAPTTLVLKNPVFNCISCEKRKTSANGI